MRYVFAFLLLFGGTISAEAKGTRVERVDVVDLGIIEVVSKTKTINDKDVSTGTRSEATETKITESGSTIRAKLNTVFGLDFKIRGVDAGTKLNLHIIWRYPQPGIKNPNTGKISLLDEYDDVFTAGPNPLTLYWSLSADYTLVPGTWSVELQQEGRRLMYQEFKVQVKK